MQSPNDPQLIPKPHVWIQPLLTKKMHLREKSMSTGKKENMLHNTNGKNMEIYMPIYMIKLSKHQHIL
jgi:hypothetical protein